MRRKSSERPHWAQLRARAAQADYLEADRESALLRSARRGDAQALASLVASHMRMVVEIAARYARPGVEPDDLVSEGTIGLLEAIRRFDAARDTRLASYARWWIRARVQRFAREKRNLVSLPSTRAARRVFAKLHVTERQLEQQLGRAPTRAELAVALDTSEHELAWLLETLGARQVEVDDLAGSAGLTSSDDPEQLLAQRELCTATRDRVRATLAQLSRRERTIFASQFPEPRCTHDELGTKLGVSRQRASQLVAGVKARLRHDLSRVAS